MDRAELARACVEVEKAGGSVREFLADQGCISPWGTWYRLQKEELRRKDYQITDGKGRANMRKITLEQKKQAVQIAIDGGDVLEFLRKNGSRNPSGLWWTIKNDVKAADPELYAKIPNLVARKPEEKKPEKPVTVVPHDDIEAAVKHEPEKPVREDLKEAARCAPVMRSEIVMSGTVSWPGFTVTSVRGSFGEWRLDEENDGIVFRGTDGEELALKTGAWMQFAGEIRAVMQILGAKFDKNEDKTA